MINSFTGVGKVDQDPRFQQTNMGKEYCRFNICIPSGKNPEGKEIFDRINCTAYGKAAEIAKYVEAGDVVGVTGPLKTLNYKKEDGTWVNSWNIQVYTLDIIRKNAQQVAPHQQQSSQPAIANKYPNIPQPPAPPPQIPLPPAPPDPNESLLPFDPYQF